MRQSPSHNTSVRTKLLITIRPAFIRASQLSEEDSRSYLAIAAAIIIAGVLISASVFVAVGEGTKTTTTETSISTTTATPSAASCDSSPTSHCVVFQQTGACSNPEFYGEPWSVTIGGTTEVQPPGATPPGANSGLEGTLNKNLTVIVFSLPDGIYSFSVRPSNFYFTPYSGTVDVNGTDVLVQIAYTGTSCTVTIASSTSTDQTTSSTSSTVPIVLYSTISPAGLRLQVTLNSSSVQPRGEVAVQIELLNTMNHNVSLALGTNQNVSTWNGDDFFCGENPSYDLVGFALFAGHFSADNISAAGLPLQLTAPIAVPCAFRLGLNNATFLPNSDKTISFSYYEQTQQPSCLVTAEVNATTGYCVTTSSSENSTTFGTCSTTSGIIGYWNPGFGYTGNTTFSSNDFTYLPSGEYTIVATDAWNQYVYAYITVL
jgi:hypothetical protein